MPTLLFRLACFTQDAQNVRLDFTTYGLASLHNLARTLESTFSSRKSGEPLSCGLWTRLCEDEIRSVEGPRCYSSNK